MAFSRKAEFVEGNVAKMVNIRSEREIEKIRESGRIVYETLSAMEERTVPGANGKELDRFAENFIRSQGGEPAFKGYMGYPSSLCISINEEVVHGIPTNRSFMEGDIVSIDCGVLKNSYYGDSARTYSVGSVRPEVGDLMRVTEEALYLGIESALAGNRVSDIGCSVQSHVESHGFSVVRELVGHGIGRELHEDPQVPNYGTSGQGVKLIEGMCMAIEPMVNLGGKEIFTKNDGWTICTRDGEPSAHFEHTVVVGSEGGKILTNGVFEGITAAAAA
ncbi:MAG: type I methionyl aminopeptidase [Candidatus Neomarinimicrobiota bacterium]|nr:type I methionyl aminopeptidase [Candidatus Neomarinimicrobiota bacterium]